MVATLTLLARRKHRPKTLPASTKRGAPAAAGLAAAGDDRMPQLPLSKLIELPLRRERPPPTEDDVIRLAQHAVEGDIRMMLCILSSMTLQGVSPESLLLRLVAPAARLLGEQSGRGQRPVPEAAAGLHTLHELVHVLVERGP